MNSLARVTAVVAALAAGIGSLAVGFLGHVMGSRARGIWLTARMVRNVVTLDPGIAVCPCSSGAGTLWPS